jgi:dTDP-4-dehydrorhamnose reductase
LVIGGPGLVGGSLLRALAATGQEALGTYHSRPQPGMVPLDVTDAASVGDLVQSFRPDVIHLTAALTAVDYCETAEDQARRINVGGAEAVARAARDTDAKLVLYSTEYVFDGTAGPYGEDDPPAPQGAYARSKLDAERAVQALAPDHLIVRTTVVFDWDPGSKNFAMQVWERLSAGEGMRVPRDQIGNPTLARFLAGATLDLVELDVSGVVDVVGADRVPRSEFAVRLAAALDLDPRLIEPVSTSSLNQIAPRPLDAGLKTERLRSLLGRPAMSLDGEIRLFAASCRGA